MDIKIQAQQHSSGHAYTFSPTEIIETTDFMEEEYASADMVFHLRYYIEGVILTPVATIGLFGGFIVVKSTLLIPKSSIP